MIKLGGIPSGIKNNDCVIVDATDVADNDYAKFTARGVEGKSYSEVAADLNAVVVPADGWLSAGETWTYASASTITVAAGAASRYQKGDKIKWTQSATVKYGVIVAVADELLTIAVNTDYTVADAAISSNYISRIENPFGYPDWFAFTFTVSGTTGSAGSYAESAKAGMYSVKGKTCSTRMTCCVTNKGSWTGNVLVNLPISRNSSIGSVYGGFHGSVAQYNQNPVTACKGLVVGEGTAYVSFLKLSQAATLTWSDMAVNDQIMVSGEYPI